MHASAVIFLNTDYTENCIFKDVSSVYPDTTDTQPNNILQMSTADELTNCVWPEFD